MVAVDVVVTDTAGRPVRNLLRQDFTVLEDGVSQNIAAFEAPPPRAKKSNTVAVDSNALMSSRALTILFSMN